MENSKSIVEGAGIPKSEKMKIVKVMRGTSFLNYRDGLEKQGIKVEFATSPFSYYRLTHRKWGKKNDGKERAIYITSKRNAGDDAEYISNDNIAMGELTEIVQETMFNKMKTKAEIKELVKEVATEIIAENHNFKVGDKVKFNGDHDGVVVKVHTSGKLKGHVDVQKKGRTSTVTLHGGNKREVRLAEATQPDLSKYPTKTLRDLYKVLCGKANTTKEKVGVEKIRAELVKRKVIKKEDLNEELFHCIQDLMKKGDSRKTADRKCRSWGVDESVEVNEEMHDCIQDYMEVHGLSYSEAMKKCRGSVWDEKGGKRGKRMRREDISENEGTNINTNALSQSEIQLAVGAINFFGTGSHPMADAKTLKYFKVEYLADIIAKNKSKLSGDAKKHLANLLKKLQKSIKEDSVTENKDINFVLDQLANAVDLYPRDEFAQDMAKNTKYNEKDFEKLYDAYFKMKAMDRFHMATDIGKSKKFLSKFGIKEEVQPVNEGMSDLEFVVDQLANSMEHYDEKEFVKHMSKETKYNANSLKKVFNAYWDLNAIKRDDMFTRVNTAKPWLKKFGIKEEVQTINEGVWSGIKLRGPAVGINGKEGIWISPGSGTSFQQLLWTISPKKGYLHSDSVDVDGEPKMNSSWTGWYGPGPLGLKIDYENNKKAGLDIENDFPFKDVNRMRKAYNRLPVKTKVQMAHGDHKLAMNFLAKYGIKP